MPSEAHVETVLSDIKRKLKELGDEVHEIHGPIRTSELEEVEAAVEDEEGRYYLSATTPNDSVYYVAASTEWKYCAVVYPYQITNHIGRQLDRDEITGVLGDDINQEELEQGEIEKYRLEAAEHILENTPTEVCWDAKFALLAYASSAEVSYRVEENENGVPMYFQTSRNIFPYTNLPSPRSLNDRIVSVINMGRRGKGFVETTFVVNRDGDPGEWELEVRF